jgi:SAM-dependent methyltransferase
MLEPTGERLVPDAQYGDVAHAEHLARYLVAGQLAGGRRVLDAACGEGYGTALLGAHGASRAVGVDVDAGAVEHARARYGREFHQADVVDLPFEDGAFDLVVSFETIEHVPDPAGALAEFRRVLAPDGVLVASTPNAREYLVDNEFHVREFTPEEFVDLVAARFDDVAVLYQQNWLASAVLREATFVGHDVARPIDVAVHKAAGAPTGRELYTIAVCGDVDLEALREVVVAAGVYEAHQLAERASQAEELVREWSARATEAERLVGEWEARATEAERQNEELRTGMDRIESSASWRLTAPLRTIKRRLRS